MLGCQVSFLVLTFLSPLLGLRLGIEAQLGKILAAVFKIKRRFEQLKTCISDLELTAGAVTLSSPVEHSLHSSIPLQNVLVGESDDVIPPPATLYLQMGKRTVKRIPDAVLLGALVVISTELLQRGVSTKRNELPPIVADLANSTLGELDGKLELLSNLQWKIDPFLRSEMDDLQGVPIDAFERFVGTDVLPWIDRVGTPLASRLLSNSSQVERVIENAKELTILGLSYLSNKNSSERDGGIDSFQLRKERDKKWKMVVGNLSSILLENLRSQPTEAIDKFIVESLLPKVDRSISPILSSLLADPEKVGIATKQIKDAIQITAQSFIVNKYSTDRSPLKAGTTKITEELSKQVDFYGEWTSKFIQNWNEFVIDMNTAVKIEKLSDMAPNRVFDFWQSRKLKHNLYLIDQDSIDEKKKHQAVNITSLTDEEGIVQRKK